MESSKKLTLLNQSADEIRERNRVIEQHLANIVKLFFLYHTQVENRIQRARQANEMALEFIAALGEQVDHLRILVEESEDVPDSHPSTARKQQRSEEKSSRDKKDRRDDKFHRQKRKAEEAKSAKVMEDLVEKKDKIVKEIQESQMALRFILDYIKGVPKEQQGLKRQLSTDELLSNIDVDDFLVHTHALFKGQKNEMTPGNTDRETQSGSKGSIFKIAELQSELKKKEKEIESLKSQLEQMVDQDVVVAELDNYRSQLDLAEEQRLKLESHLERVSQEKTILIEKDLKMRDQLSEVQDLNLKLKQETTEYLQQMYTIRNENEELKRNINLKGESLTKLEDQSEQISDLQAECQNARNNYISLESAYKELLKEFGDMRDREVHSEALRVRVEGRLSEVDTILETIKEKNEFLEAANQDLTERNAYLEDKIISKKKETCNIFEENCNMKTKLLDGKNKEHDLDVSGLSADYQQIVMEDYHQVKMENESLKEDMEILKRKIISLNDNLRSLTSHVSSVLLKNKELRNRGRSSTRGERKSVVGESNIDFSRSSPMSYFDFKGASVLETNDSPDLLNIIYAQASFIERNLIRSD